MSIGLDKSLTPFNLFLCLFFSTLRSTGVMTLLCPPPPPLSYVSDNPFYSRLHNYMFNFFFFFTGYTFTWIPEVLNLPHFIKFTPDMHAMHNLGIQYEQKNNTGRLNQ